MDPGVAAGIVIVLLFGLLLLSLHIGFALALVGFIGICLVAGYRPAFSILGTHLFSYVNVYELAVIPLFILMGNLAIGAGVTRGLYDFNFQWLGRLPGGLAMTTVGACAGFAALTGSSVATVATVGKVALPEMKRYQYDDSLALGSVAASGTLGVLIPPSGLAIIYAITVECSVGKVLMGGFLPGIISAVIYMLMIMVRVKRRPALAPRSDVVVSWRSRLASFKLAWPTLLLFFIVIGGIYSGVTTATEAASLGAFVALLMVCIMTRGDWRQVKDSLKDAVSTTAVIFAMMVGASIFSLFLTMSGLPAQLAEWLVGLQVHKMIILCAILAIYIPLGMFLDSISMLLVSLPVFYPIIDAMGFNAIWFGILVIKTIEIGLITPPVGMNVYVLKSIAPQIEAINIFKYVLWFLVMDVITLALLVAVPQITLFLPQHML